MQYKIGRVTHYYRKIGVAVVLLDSDLSLGERIKFVRGGEDLFEQDVTSLQSEHEKVSTVGKGAVVGIQTNMELKEGAEVYKVVE